MTLASCWMAYRLQAPELALIGAAAGLVMHFLARVFIDLVQLVVDTLVPR